MHSNVNSEVTDLKKHFTCASCQIQLEHGEAIRIHYRTEWHSYNLKRKIADLKPLTLEEYEVKANKLNNSQLPENNIKSTCRCHECKKTFTCEKTYNSHLNSKKHKDNAKTADNSLSSSIIEVSPMEIEREVEEEEVDSDEWDEDFENPIDKNQCLFCTTESANFFNNLEHMTAFHSFFIPDIEYCVDIKGLMRFLGEKVAKYYMCLWCNEKGRTFYSIDAAKSHMLDKGHCRMLFEGVALTEYVDFYDYSSSYPDAEHCDDKEDEVSIDVLDGSEFQLVLPSGVTVGHRSLLRYYKQNASRSSVVVQSKNTKKLHKVLATYRALGWSQTDQEEAARKARDIHFLKRVQSKWTMKQGVKNNKFQKHFRQQVNY